MWIIHVKIHTYICIGLLRGRRYCHYLVKSKAKENALLRIIKEESWKNTKGIIWSTVPKPVSRSESPGKLSTNVQSQADPKLLNVISTK